MAEIEHFVHPDHKEHARFSEVKDIVLNLLPSSVQMEGKTKVVQTTIGEAVASVGLCLMSSNLYLLDSLMFVADTDTVIRAWSTTRRWATSSRACTSSSLVSASRWRNSGSASI